MYVRGHAVTDQTARIEIAIVQRIVEALADGVSSRLVAEQLRADGVPVPRADGADERDCGYNLPTEHGQPSIWNAAAVLAVAAAPEADPADDYAAARAKVPGDTHTTLTVRPPA